MPEFLQSEFYMREVKIETLYQRLPEVTNHQEQAELLKELELITGVRIFY